MPTYLTQTDADQIVELIGECLEQWDDPSAWQRHLAASAERALGGFGGKLIFMQAERVLDATMGEANDALSRAVLREVVARGGPSVLPGFATHLERVRVDGAAASTTKLLCGEATYHRTALYQQYMRRIDADDTLFALGHCAGNGLLLSVSLSRAASERAFSEREQHKLAGLVSALSRQVGRKLGTFAHKGRHELSLRERQTLAALLDGDSEKQIAMRIGVSPLTVHDHVKSLYRYFGASSRGELMAYFVRRSPVLKRATAAPTARGG